MVWTIGLMQIKWLIGLIGLIDWLIDWLIFLCTFKPIFLVGQWLLSAVIHPGMLRQWPPVVCTLQMHSVTSYFPHSRALQKLFPGERLVGDHPRGGGWWRHRLSAALRALMLTITQSDPVLPDLPWTATHSRQMSSVNYTGAAGPKVKGTRTYAPYSFWTAARRYIYTSGWEEEHFCQLASSAPSSSTLSRYSSCGRMLFCRPIVNRSKLCCYLRPASLLVRSFAY